MDKKPKSITGCPLCYSKNIWTNKSGVNIVVDVAIHGAKQNDS